MQSSPWHVRVLLVQCVCCRMLRVHAVCMHLPQGVHTAACTHTPLLRRTLAHSPLTHLFTDVLPYSPGERAARAPLLPEEHGRPSPAAHPLPALPQGPAGAHTHSTSMHMRPPRSPHVQLGAIACGHARCRAVRACTPPARTPHARTPHAHMHAHHMHAHHMHAHHTHAHHLHLHHMHTTCLRTCVHMNTAAGHRAAELQPLRWLLPADQPHLGRGMRRALADPVHMTCAARCSVVQRTHSACALIPSACPSPCPCTCICPCPCARCLWAGAAAPRGPCHARGCRRGGGVPRTRRSLQARARAVGRRGAPRE